MHEEKQFELATFKLAKNIPRPFVRWWWPGLDVTKEILIKDLQSMQAAGIGGAEIQAFMIGSPFKLEKRDPARAARAHRFLTPYYQEMVKTVLDEAAQLGLKIDVTVGSAWPVGSGSVSSEQSLKTLLVGLKRIKSDGSYRGAIPRPKTPFFYTLARLARLIVGYNIVDYNPSQSKVVGLVAAKILHGKPCVPGLLRSLFITPKACSISPDSIIDLMPFLTSGNIIEWSAPPGEWQIFAFWGGPTGARPLLDARSSPEKLGTVLDHFAKEPITAQLNRLLGEGQKYYPNHFGSTLRAFFTDSLELMAEWMWTDRFFDEFQTRRGYDIRPFLPVCYVPNRDNKYLKVVLTKFAPLADFLGDQGDRVRYDWELTISDLFVEEFGGAMAQWAQAHQIQSRIQAYGIRADVMKMYGISHIPETEQLYAGGMLDFLKLAGSAALIYKKPIVTAESLVWNKRDYMTTPLKWKVGADRLFVAGINQLIYHGFPYSSDAFPYPGFHPFSSPYFKLSTFSSDMGVSNPFWAFFPNINRYIARCQYLLQQGITKAEIGLFYPLFNYPDTSLIQEELIGGILDEFDAPAERGSMNAAVKKHLDPEEKWLQAQIALGKRLMEHGYNYIHINEDALLKATVDEGKIVIGDARLNSLIFYRISQISLQLTQKLAEIIKQKGTILFIGEFPKRQPGYFNSSENDPLIAQIMSDLIQTKTVQFSAEEQPVIELIRDQIKAAPGLQFQTPQANIQSIHKVSDNGDFYFIRSSTRMAQQVQIGFPHSTGSPVLLDPWTGEAYRLSPLKIEGNSLWLSLNFSQYASWLIYFPRKQLENAILNLCLPYKSPATPVDSIQSLIIPGSQSGEWTFTGIIHDSKGNQNPIGLKLNTLEDWRKIPALHYHASEGSYKTTFMLDQVQFSLAPVWLLDLGEVYDVAVVTINGHKLLPLLIPPYTCEVQQYCIVGNNSLEVNIVTTRRNQLIGFGMTRNSDFKQFRGNKPLMPAGLVGPVKLVPATRN